MKIVSILSLALCCCFTFLIPTDYTYSAPNHYEVAAQAATIGEDLSLPAQLIITEQSERVNQVQVFDVKKGEVVQTTANNEYFQKNAHQWLSGITGLAPEISPDLKAKYIVRVPVQPIATLQVGTTKLNVGEIFLFYYDDKEPMLLIFDEAKKPYIFHIHNDVKPFIQYLSIPD
ncbi:MAG TPA: hypothetical protein IAA29_13525 [Candidatus Paenibacillus intestinavium]|nr:hypothetical protein [Candidatus Paenibacillus intestinavium]